VLHATLPLAPLLTTLHAMVGSHRPRDNPLHGA